MEILGRDEPHFFDSQSVARPMIIFTAAIVANRNLKRDLVALAIAGVAAFIGVSLATYNPADSTSFDTSIVRDNAFGTSGAIFSSFLVSNLGVTANFLVASLVCIAFWLIRNQEIDLPAMRGVGWLLTLVGGAAFLSLVLPNLVQSFEMGSGGRLGSSMSQILLTQFSLAGGVIVSIFVTLAGLLMFSDYALLRFAHWGLSTVLAIPSALEAPKAKPKSKKKKVVHEEDEYLEDEYEEIEDEIGDEEDLRIRIPARDKLKVVSDDVGESIQQELEFEEEEAAEEDYDLADETADAIEDEVEEVDEPVVTKLQPKKVEKTTPEPKFEKKQKQKAPDEREVVMQQLNQASLVEPEGEYELPAIDMLVNGDDICFEDQEREVRAKAKILEKTFQQFGFNVKVVEIETGPVIAQYEIELEAGLRLSKIMGLSDDLAIALRVPSVRIVAPIPGKNTVGIEVPNETRQVVRLRDVMEEGTAKTLKMKIPLFLGKDVSGNALVADLASLPHLLIAGRTGTGKSVCLNAIITSMLMTRRPDEVRLLMIDPKMVELSGYARLPHLMHPVVTDMKKAEAILAWAVDKMEERYTLLARAGVRHITSYNQLGEEELLERLEIDDPEERANVPLHLPFIVIVADEMADLMMTAGKDVEQHIIRLAQKSRAVGIHLILATQKPTVDVITGLIKSNLPARISFQVASRTDSRVVLDEMGADKLLGNGDMLFLWPGTSKLLRGQGTYLSDDEIDAVTDACSQGEQEFVNELMNLKIKEEGEEDDAEKPTALKKRDELYSDAVDVVVREQRGSVSLLQRNLGIGYGRAARLIDYMAEDNIVGPYNGSQAREILVSVAEWEAMQGGGAEEAEDDTPEPPPTKIKMPTVEAEPELIDEAEEDVEYEYEDEVGEDDAAEEEVVAEADDVELGEGEEYEYEYVYEDDDEELEESA
ncbi:DNA translocase FtsK [Pirellulaceae bacterium]|jgi:S-DNA-T family DNA segregation ATPase FtsK/SpoIIIE|nr:DNA translocase FtsK [Pirellulaceae bacterium]